MFNMTEQCEQEFAETHKLAFQSFLDKYNQEGKNKIEPVWQEHIAHKDFSYEMTMEKGVVKGFYEGKQDTWDTDNIVFELVGSVSSNIIENFGIQFPAWSQKFDEESSHNDYMKIHNFIKSCVKGEQGDINLGYLTVEKNAIGNHPLLAYYRRPQERKRINGKWQKTGNVLSRIVCIYRGKMLREIAMKHFEEKKGFLQIVPNQKGYKYWASINLLTKASVFDAALLAKVYLKNDKVVDKVELT